MLNAIGHASHDASEIGRIPTFRVQFWRGVSQDHIIVIIILAWYEKTRNRGSPGTQLHRDPVQGQFKDADRIIIIFVCGILCVLDRSAILSLFVPNMIKRNRIQLPYCCRSRIAIVACRRRRSAHLME